MTIRTRGRRVAITLTTLTGAASIATTGYASTV
ncbi:MAG: hypothetical protein QOH44_469, partial [Actinomycetota bacterium]|nr:hypothetical protein [Actinomycetota bacterium]